MKGSFIKILAKITDFLNVLGSVAVISLFVFEVMGCWFSIYSLETTQREYGKVLSECKTVTQPEFFSDKSNRKFKTPVESELARRLAEKAQKAQKEEKEQKDKAPFGNSKIQNYKHLNFKPEEHISLQSVDILDTATIREMLRKHHSEIKIVKRKDSL